MNNKKNKKGFTLAEVLITLSIIGVIAAILFPSILANYTERTLKAKRQAFVARMSQAMGEMADTFGNYQELSCTDPNNTFTCTDTGSALKFISEGLSKAYKIASVCDKDSLAACDIPDIITKQDGSTFSLYENTTTFSKYENGSVKFGSIVGLSLLDLTPAAFMTKNGESVLIFYNPTCQNVNVQNIGHEALMCVNMIFDLNGAKGKPNKFGEDIWFLTSFYPSSPNVAAPRVYDFNKTAFIDATDSSGNPIRKLPLTSGSSASISSNITHDVAAAACAALGPDVVLPSYEEASSILLNLSLLTDHDELKRQAPSDGGNQKPFSLWSSTLCAKNAYKISQADYGGDWNDDGCHGVTVLYYNIPACVYENSAQ